MNRTRLKYEVVNVVRKSSGLEWEECLEVARRLTPLLEREITLAEIKQAAKRNSKNDAKRFQSKEAT